MAGVHINESCITGFNDFKLRSNGKYMIFSLSCDLKHVIIEKSGSENEELDQLIADLPLNDSRYIVYKYRYDIGLEGRRSKMIFIHWNPSTSSIKNKLIYAATAQSVKQALQGLNVNIQAGRTDELTPEAFLERCGVRN